MNNFSPREAFPPPVFLLFLYLSPSSIAKVGGYGGLFSLWNRPPFPALVSYSRSPCQSPWTHCLGRNGSVLQQMTRWVCEVETCRKAPFSWEIVLSCFGRLQCCFFFFLSCWRGLSQLWETPQSTLKEVWLQNWFLPYRPSNRIHIKSHFLRCCFVERAPSGFHRFFECAAH